MQEGIKVGNYIEEVMESAVFDRIAAQTAKQIIVQKIKDAERNRVLNAYKNRKGELITGIIKRIERGNVILDVGSNVEAVILKEHVIFREHVSANEPSRESMRIGDRRRGYLYEIRTDVRGAQLFVSRTSPEFLIELLKIEIPEIGEGLIQIVKTVRIPGIKAKVAIRPCDPSVKDPLGACIGIGGSRIQAVSDELYKEHIDIVLWDANPVQFVINAMSPAHKDIVSIVFDEESGSVDVAIKGELSQAIGHRGQNVRLASQLTGRILNVMNETAAEEKKGNESRSLINLFCKKLSIDENIASILVDAGFTSLKDIAYVLTSGLIEIEAFDETLVEKLRQKAKEAILIEAIAQEEIAGIDPKILELEKMDNVLAINLAAKGLFTLQDLAEQSVDDLMFLEIEGLDEQRAASIIMQARRPLFADMR